MYPSSELTFYAIVKIKRDASSRIKNPLNACKSLNIELEALYLVAYLDLQTQEEKKELSFFLRELSFFFYLSIYFSISALYRIG